MWFELFIFKEDSLLLPCHLMGLRSWSDCFSSLPPGFHLTALDVQGKKWMPCLEKKKKKDAIFRIKKKVDAVFHLVFSIILHIDVFLMCSWWGGKLHVLLLLSFWSWSFPLILRSLIWVLFFLPWRGILRISFSENMFVMISLLFVWTFVCHSHLKGFFCLVYVSGWCTVY